MRSDGAGFEDEARVQGWLDVLRDGSADEKRQARRRLADVFEHRRQFEEATELLEANVREGEHTEGVFRALARLYRLQGDDARSRQAAAEATKYQMIRLTQADAVVPIAESASPIARTAMPVMSKTRAMCVAGCIAVLVGAVVGLAAFFMMGRGGSQQQVDLGEALSLCRSFVQERLQAPATASFASGTDETATANGDGSFTVRSYVDAQNGAGENVRTRYACVVRPVPNTDTWSLVSLDTS
jgi:hypothetical protein